MVATQYCFFFISATALSAPEPGRLVQSTRSEPGTVSYSHGFIYKAPPLNSASQTVIIEKKTAAHLRLKFLMRSMDPLVAGHLRDDVCPAYRFPPHVPRALGV